MAQIKVFFQRYRWWILAGSSVIIISLITFLALAVVIVEEYSPVIETPIQLPATPLSNLSVIFDTPTPAPEIDLIPKPPTETKKSEAQTRQLAYVQRVIDGDSIEVIVDGAVYELRYIGIDAPETGMPLFKDATEANKSFVEHQIVELESDFSNIDQYGRLLRYVYLPDGRLVNVELVGLGLAAAYVYAPDIKYQELMNSSEQDAKDAGLGLWAPSVTPTLDLSREPENLIQVDPACSQFNAPGNDNNNKTEEYVCIINNGPGIAALQGWSIHDDYGWAYQFPLFNLEGNSIVKVITGCGIDSSQELYWCKDETAVWNNDGDCVYLLNSEGIEASKYCY